MDEANQLRKAWRIGASGGLRHRRERHSSSKCLHWLVLKTSDSEWRARLLGIADAPASEQPCDRQFGVRIRVRLVLGFAVNPVLTSNFHCCLDLAHWSAARSRQGRSGADSHESTFQKPRATDADLGTSEEIRAIRSAGPKNDANGTPECPRPRSGAGGNKKRLRDKTPEPLVLVQNGC